MNYKVYTHEFAGDIYTPISVYLKIRDLYPQSALLESSDYHSFNNSRSFIAIQPLASVAINKGITTIKLPDQLKREDTVSIAEALDGFMSHFTVEGEYGLFGYTAYDAVKYLEDIPIKPSCLTNNDAPDVFYILYRYTLIFDHFRHTLTVKEIVAEGESQKSEEIMAVILNRNYASYGFLPVGEVTSPINDRYYCDMVKKGIEHCLRGDVFQIVLSRRFIQRFTGDDFEVYRALRRINPSPYLFYFDFGGFRIFGSSPETHCKIENRIITIDPIAGTTFRTGDDAEDCRRAEELLADPKENAEHVMLVDLARNDVSRNADNVKVEFYKQIQYYSHVIHLVSRVSGLLKADVSPIKSYLETFPAGTLSGAPKVRAMELINAIEPHNRGIYGGAIGYMGLNGDINQAITIRTFVSRNGQLEFQAGAGVVALSNPERELQEVNNKLGALSKAMRMESGK